MLTNNSKKRKHFTTTNEQKEVQELEDGKNFKKLISNFKLNKNNEIIF